MRSIMASRLLALVASEKMKWRAPASWKATSLLDHFLDRAGYGYPVDHLAEILVVGAAHERCSFLASSLAIGVTLVKTKA